MNPAALVASLAPFYSVQLGSVSASPDTVDLATGFRAVVDSAAVGFLPVPLLLLRLLSVLTLLGVLLRLLLLFQQRLEFF